MNPSSNQNSPPPVVISGAGLAACLGLDRDAVWQAVRAGRCGAGPLTAMESNDPGAVGGQAPPLEDESGDKTPRQVRYLRKVLRDALLDAGLIQTQSTGEFDFPCPPHRCGIILGTTLHGMRAGGEFFRTGSPEPLRNFLSTAVIRSAYNGFGFSGPALTTCSACSSSLGAIALAMTLLQTGELDLVAAGGYDTISEYAYAGFSSLRLVAGGAVRPFARDRAGMKIGEGYGIVILERAGDAQKRGHKELARVLAFGESADAHHLTQPHPTGDGAARAIESALRGANLDAGQIDLIAAHGTATPDNDAGEYAALARIWGDDLPRVPVVAFKSHLSHTLGGAGAVELILSAMALQSQTVPPCANVGPNDSDFPGLNLATGAAIAAPLRASLNLSLGFGGANTCVVLAPGISPSPAVSGEGTRRESTKSDDDVPGGRDVLITGIGVVLPGAIGNAALLARLNQAGERVIADTPQIDESTIARLLSARRLRRISGYVKLSLAAAMLALEDAAVADLPAFCGPACAFLGTTHGSSQYCVDYYGQIVREGLAAANPLLFAEGVPNAAAAHLSLATGIKGACQTIIGSRTAGLDALGLAAARIASGQCDRAIVGAAEEFCDVVNSAYAHCSLHAPRGAALPFAAVGEKISSDAGSTFAVGCGAVALVLESRSSVESRNARVRGSIEKYAANSSADGRQIESAGKILEELGNPPAVISSANGTWIDRAEAAALRQMSRQTGRRPAVSSLCGYIAETFSVMPLAGIAAATLSGRLPPLLGPGLADCQVAGNAEGIESFAALASDYAGLCAGVRVGINRESLGA